MNGLKLNILILTLLVNVNILNAAPIVAVVGNGEVTEQDISDWQAAQGCYGEDAITSRRAGFMRMFEAAILDEVLTGQKHPITREDYRKEVRRIDQETRAPEILNCIKKHFGDAAARYERIFVRPILGQRFIREFVKSDPRVQAKAYQLRDAALKDIANNKTFKITGAERAIVCSTAVYSVEEDTSVPDAVEPWKRWSPFEAAFIEEHLKGLKPGEVNAKPIEDELNIKIVRLIRIVGGGKYFFELLTIPKLSTEDYLKNIKKLPCEISDKELHDWVVSIKGNPLLSPAEIAP